MLRKLGILGLAVPLIAIIGVLAYLFLFGTSEPTFEVATLDLARDHTVLRIDDQTDAAMIVPTEPPDSVVLVFVLPDDERHVWSATRALGVLDFVESHVLAVIPVTGAVEHDRLIDLTRSASEFVPASRIYIAAFDGSSIAAICNGPIGMDWTGVVVVESTAIEVTEECADLPLLRVEDGRSPGAEIVQWMVEPQ